MLRAHICLVLYGSGCEVNVAEVRRQSKREKQSQFGEVTARARVRTKRARPTAGEAVAAVTAMGVPAVAVADTETAVIAEATKDNYDQCWDHGQWHGGDSAVADGGSFTGSIHVSLGERATTDRRCCQVSAVADE